MDMDMKQTYYNNNKIALAEKFSSTVYIVNILHLMPYIVANIFKLNNKIINNGTS